MENKIVKQSMQLTNDENKSSAHSNDNDRVDHNAELGEENVELVDSEWADFERALRYDGMNI